MEERGRFNSSTWIAFPTFIALKVHSPSSSKSAYAHTLPYRAVRIVRLFSEQTYISCHFSFRARSLLRALSLTHRSPTILLESYLDYLPVTRKLLSNPRAQAFPSLACLNDPGQQPLVSLAFHHRLHTMVASLLLSQNGPCVPDETQSTLLFRPTLPPYWHSSID